MMSTSAPRVDGPRDHLLSFLAGGNAGRIASLRAALDRIAADSTRAVRKLVGVDLRLAYRSLEMMPAADAPGHVGESGVYCLLKASQSTTQVLSWMDRSAAFGIVEALLGGDGTEAPYLPERPISKIEARVLGAFFELVAKTVDEHFLTPAGGSFVPDEPVGRLDPSSSLSLGGTVALAEFHFVVADRAGRLVLMLPPSVVRSPELAPPASKPMPAAGPDIEWARQMQGEIGRAGIRLNAVLDEVVSNLLGVSSLRVGQVIELNTTIQSSVWLECNDRRLFTCHLGKLNGAYALRVNGVVESEPGLIEA